MFPVGILARSLVVILGLTSLAGAKPHAKGRAGGKSARAIAAPHHAPRHAVGRANLPWQGRLVDPAQLPDGDGYHIRRPARAFGTERTAELVHEVIEATIALFPERHVLAIGDLSAEHGGRITEHASHQSGRDVDIGLYYLEKPAAYPENFVSATEDNLDCEATWGLIDRFVDTADQPGGAQIIFLDFRVQGLLYAWAKEHGISQKYLDHVFQYPHGKSSSEGIVRHWPNHDNHIHVRFKG